MMMMMMMMMNSSSYYYLEQLPGPKFGISSSGATTGGSGGSRLRALARRGRLATSVKIFF